MHALLVYGSLIHPGEHRKLPGFIEAIPVHLRGYRRSFTQTPSWRRGEGRQIAVLRLEESPEDSLNLIALLFKELDFTELDRRERGYRRIALPADQLTPFGDTPLPGLDSYHLYLGRNELHDPALLPNPEYLDLCLEGAKAWGEAFYREFLETTVLGDGKSLTL
jgi:hypothetical protein